MRRATGLARGIRSLRAYPYLWAALSVGVVAGAMQIAGLPAGTWLLAGFALLMAGRSAMGMLRRLRSGAFGVDALAVVAIGATLAVGEWWAAWVIVLMLSTGEALEDFAGRRARHDLSALIDRTPRTAHIISEAGTVHDIDVDEVRTGDRLLVGPAELVPVDGQLVDALAVVDESSVTGESIPVEKKAGDELLSGTVNGSSAVTVIASRLASESQYQSIVRIVEEASRSRPPLVRLADRYAIPFTAFALALAAAAWWATGDPARFAEVLVVATPCPLLVAAPVAFIAGMSRAARHGVIVKGGGAFEVLHRAPAVVFDKTGTLTLGRPSLVAVHVEGDASRSEVLELAADAEQVSPHVLAHATVRAALSEGIALRTPSSAEENPAHGVSASVDGHRVLVGKRVFIETATGRAVRRPDLEPGEIATYVAIDGVWAATLVFRDRTRPNARTLVESLRSSGVRVIAMVTGDDVQTAQHVAASVGIDDVHAGCLPADKVAVVQGMQVRPVVMVGDGVNDAPVLAAADVGVAMGAAGATAASESADVVLLEDDIAGFGSVRAVARATIRIALQSIWLGMGLSGVLMFVAAFGFLPALIGALLQEVVDVVSILWALRALGRREARGAAGPSSRGARGVSTTVPHAGRARAAED
ncbi:heavy metal translocating P-type ATPase [Microbacterium sp. NPDC057407]|uniref:heavy metal translocating P-type ATPase n=1 Tax=Microbacterium sp. NPDC057407 TaxID=3346120 RepID=UPI0036704D48